MIFGHSHSSYSSISQFLTPFCFICVQFISISIVSFSVHPCSSYPLLVAARLTTRFYFSKLACSHCSPPQLSSVSIVLFLSAHAIFNYVFLPMVVGVSFFILYSVKTITAAEYTQRRILCPSASCKSFCSLYF